jgi:RNA polymerase sigma factor (sigma-70 family)
MNKSAVGDLLAHLRNTWATHAARELTDGQLLRLFLDQRESVAFAVLMNRHGPMVLDICRQILGNSHSAEDAFQATFMVLFRRARSIRRRNSLGSWLFGVAKRIAAKDRARITKRRQKEALAMERPTPGALNEPDSELRRILQEEIERLPDKFAAAVVLCYIEGKTYEQAGKEVGCAKQTLASRLERACEILRNRLTRRGVSLSSAALGAALGQQTSKAAVPALLTIQTANAAAALLDGGTLVSVGLSGGAVAMVEEALKAHVGLKASIALILMILGLGGGGLAAHNGLTGKTASVQEKEAKAPHASKEAPGPQKAAPPVDLHGDPLPDGAIARLGSMRLQHGLGMTTSLAYGPDGKTIASGSSHGELRLWAVATGKLLRILVDPDHSGFMVRSLAFSPDGTLLAAGKGRTGLGLWDVATGRRRSGFAGESFDVRCLAFSPDGKHLAVCCERDPAVHFYKVEDQKPAGKLLAHEGSVFACGYSPDGKLLATGGQDKTVSVWELDQQKAVHRFSVADAVTDLLWTPEGKHLVASTKSHVTVWEVGTGAKVHHLTQDMNDWRSLSISPDGRRLVSAGTVWDITSGELLCECKGHTAGGTAFAPDGKSVALAGYSGAILFFDPQTGQVLSPPDGLPSSGRFQWVSFLPGGKKLLTMRLGEKVQLWTADGAHVQDFDVRAFQRGIALAPTGKVFAIQTALRGGVLGSLEIWDIAGGKKLRVLDGTPKNQTPGILDTIAFSPDSKLVASSWGGEEIFIWNVNTGQRIATLPGHRGGSYFFTFSADGKRVVSAGLDKMARFWDVASGKEWRIAVEHDGWVRDAAPSGATWAICSPQNQEMRQGVNYQLQIRRIETSEVLLPIKGVSTNHCAFSPNGHTIAVDGSGFFLPDAEEKIQLIELATGGVRREFRGHLGSLWAFSFSDDGKTLASASDDGTILIWDVTR